MCKNIKLYHKPWFQVKKTRILERRRRVRDFTSRRPREQDEYWAEAHFYGLVSRSLIWRWTACYHCGFHRKMIMHMTQTWTRRIEIFSSAFSQDTWEYLKIIEKLENQFWNCQILLRSTKFCEKPLDIFQTCLHLIIIKSFEHLFKENR